MTIMLSPPHAHTRTHTHTLRHISDAVKRQNFDPYSVLQFMANFARDSSQLLRNSFLSPPSSLVPPSSFLPCFLPLSPVSFLPSFLPFLFHSPFFHPFMKLCARHCVIHGENRCEQDKHLWFSFLKPGLKMLWAWKPTGGGGQR